MLNTTVLKEHTQQTNSEAGLSLSTSITGNAVTTVAIGAAGVITITYNTKVNNNDVLVLTPTAGSGSLTWDCATGSTVASKLRPANCR